VNVFKRRMFQEGGPANVITSKPVTRGFNVPTPAGTENIERQVGVDGKEQFFVVRRDVSGNEISKKPIDLTLSPTGDPVEAARVGERQQFGDLVTGLGAGITGAAAVAGSIPFFGKRFEAIGKGVGSLVSGAGRLLSPVVTQSGRVIAKKDVTKSFKTPLGKPKKDAPKTYDVNSPQGQAIINNKNFDPKTQFIPENKFAEIIGKTPPGSQLPFFQGFGKGVTGKIPFQIQPAQALTYGFTAPAVIGSAISDIETKEFLEDVTPDNQILALEKILNDPNASQKQKDLARAKIKELKAQGVNVGDLDTKLGGPFDAFNTVEEAREEAKRVLGESATSFEYRGVSYSIREKDDKTKSEVKIPRPSRSAFLSSPQFLNFLKLFAEEAGKTGSVGQAGVNAAIRAAKGIQTEPMDYKLAESVSEMEESLNTNIKKFKSSERNLARLNYTINLLESEPAAKEAFGAKGAIANFIEQAKALGGAGATKFEDLPARTRVDLIVRALRNEEVKNLLGESGRTISNLDREIVAQIFGDLNAFTSQGALLAQLRNIRDRLTEDLSATGGSTVANLRYFANVRQPSLVQKLNSDIVQQLVILNDEQSAKDFVANLNYDPDDGGTRNQGVTEIPLATPGTVTQVADDEEDE